VFGPAVWHGRPLLAWDVAPDDHTRHRHNSALAFCRTVVYQNAQALLSPFMRCGVRCLDDVFSRVSGKPLKGGYIVVIQTHGRNGQYNPHLHIIATSGGWDQQANEWMHLDYLPYTLLRKKWQWYLDRKSVV